MANSKANLAALHVPGMDTAAGSVRRRPTIQPRAVEKVPVKGSLSRVDTAPITFHFPPQVRNQLKILAIEQGKLMEQLGGEALNDLFAKYGKPEIAPTERRPRGKRGVEDAEDR